MAYVATPLKARGMDWIFADNEGQATGCLKRLRLDGITLPEKKSLKKFILPKSTLSRWHSYSKPILTH